VKKLIASRVAAELQKQHELRVETGKGGLGELSVSVDGSKVYNSNPLWYPTPAGVIKKVRAALTEWHLLNVAEEKANEA
jgi:hypothetical protein